MLSTKLYWRVRMVYKWVLNLKFWGSIQTRKCLNAMLASFQLKSCIVIIDLEACLFVRTPIVVSEDYTVWILKQMFWKLVCSTVSTDVHDLTNWTIFFWESELVYLFIWLENKFISTKECTVSLLRLNIFWFCS
jgi:hypothetical protein